MEARERTSQLMIRFKLTYCTAFRVTYLFFYDYTTISQKINPFLI